MTIFNVYVEDTRGNYLDDYTIEAETIEQAYELAYEKHNWKPLEIYIDDEQTNTD